MGAFIVTGQRARQMRVVPAEVLKRLYARSDRHGLVQTAAHLALLRRRGDSPAKSSAGGARDSS